jgi:hypothetical protein
MKRNSRTKKELSFKEKYNLEKERNDKLENQLEVVMKMMKDGQRTIKRLERMISIFEPAVVKHMRKNV